MQLLLLLLLMGPGRAQAPPEPTATQEQAPDEPDLEEGGYAGRLQAAKESYLLGRHAEASEAFRRLVLRAQAYGDVPVAVEAEALAFLGEIQYMRGDIDEARSTFRLLLQKDPTWHMSPWAHPPAVRGTFEAVRDEVLAERQQMAGKPLPWWGYAPFGIPQIGQRQPVRGGVYATLQASLAIASIVSWVWIDQVQIGEDETLSLDLQAERARSATLIRNGMSWPTAAAFYVTWAVSIADASLSWRRQHPPLTPMVTVLPAEGGGHVQVGFVF
jgi:tetratricopeptide (TPR) repeat protein